MSQLELIGLIGSIFTIISVVTWSKSNWKHAGILLLLLVGVYLVVSYFLGLFPFTSETSLSAREYIITSDKAGDYFIGMKYKEIEPTINKNHSKGIFHQGTPESDDIPIVFIKDSRNKDELVLEILGDTVFSIIVLSENYKTENGVYPGMKVSEVQKKYSNLPLFMIETIGEEEAFLPVGSKLSFVVSSYKYAGSEEGLERAGNYPIPYKDFEARKAEVLNYKYILGDSIHYVQDVTNDYDNRRKIIFIKPNRYR